MPGLSYHASRRMAERGITQDHIDAALRRRSGPPQPGDGGNVVILGYGEAGRILKVVLTPDQQLVVSVMWVEE